MNVPPTVLIVDGTACVPKELFGLQSWMGHRLIFVETVSSALRVVEREKPEIVITDLQLPDMKGLDFLRQLSSIDPYITTIVLCDESRMSVAQEAIRRGCYEYVMKPIKMDELEMSLESAIDRVALLGEGPNSEGTQQNGWAHQLEWFL